MGDYHMKQNVTFSIGNIAIVDKINEKFSLFDSCFDGVFGRAKEVKETAKALAANRLGECVSTHRLTEVYPQEFFRELGFKESPAGGGCPRHLVFLGPLAILHPGLAGPDARVEGILSDDSPRDRL